MADLVAGGGETQQCGCMPQALCVLPFTHDSQLPVPEPHHGSDRRALRLSTCVPAKQSYHRAPCGFFWL